MFATLAVFPKRGNSAIKRFFDISLLAESRSIKGQTVCQGAYPEINRGRSCPPVDTGLAQSEMQQLVMVTMVGGSSSGDFTESTRAERRGD